MKVFDRVLTKLHHADRGSLTGSLEAITKRSKASDTVHSFVAFFPTWQYHSGYSCTTSSSHRLV